MRSQSALRLALLSLWAAAPAAWSACPLEVQGTWQLANANDNTAVLMSFTSDGWANVLNGPGEQSPTDIAAQVGYRLAPPQEPRRIDFQARRGNDLFPPGTSSWDITGSSDDSFTARRADSMTGE